MSNVADVTGSPVSGGGGEFAQASVGESKPTSKRRFKKWLDKRIPTSDEITLTQRRIFILPSRAGAGFLIIIAGLLLAAVNYQNNMLFALTFVLLGLLLISILHTYSNLSGLTLRSKGSDAVFCKTHAEFVFSLSRKGTHAYHNICLDWPDSPVSTGSLIDNDETQVSVFVPTRQRGVLRPGRLRVQTWYPLGLMRAWTWLDFDSHCLVYPEPLFADAALDLSAHTDDNGPAVATGGGDEFSGYSAFQPGDALNQVSWQHVARGLPPMSRRFAMPLDQRMWIDWDHFDGLSAEQRLSHMCFQVLHADEHNIEYGLSLPGIELQPASGAEHRSACLRALALFESDDLVVGAAE